MIGGLHLPYPILGKGLKLRLAAHYQREGSRYWQCTQGGSLWARAPLRATVALVVPQNPLQELAWQTTAPITCT